MSHSFVVLAQAAGGAFDLKTMALPLLAFIGIWYFLVLRPQQKQMGEHKTLLAGLKKGDDVVTQSGILGKVYAVSDKIVTVEVANGVRLRVLKTAVQSKGSVTEEVIVPAKAEEKEEK